jgi:transposase-like protein
MNIIKFNESFPDEMSCILHFKAQRDKQGVICPRCGCREHIWLKNKLRYECKQCHSRQSLRTGTVMQYSKLPFQYWYIAMHLLTSTKKSFSALEMQRQIGHKRYQPIWELCNKLRDVMGKRDDLYNLSGEVELDNAFITTLVPDGQKDEPRKRGAGSQNKSKVVVMTESTTVENPKTGKPPKKVNHIKMKIVSDLKADTTAEIIKKHVDFQAELTTDDSTSYKELKKYVKSHQAQVIKNENIPKVLPWVHIAIGNVKRLLLNVHHQLKSQYLQYYTSTGLSNHLNEFCYKFNRRYFGERIFDRMIMVAVCYQTDFKSKIYNRTYCG